MPDDSYSYQDDPAFQALAPADQMHYMASQDPDFQKLGPVDQLSYLAHLRGGGPINSTTPIPQPQMNPVSTDLPGWQPQSPGTVTGPDMASGSKVPRSIQQAPDSTGMAIAGMAGIGAAASGLEPIAAPIASAGAAFMRNHPLVSTAGLGIAQQMLPPGIARDIVRQIPTWAPLMVGGKSTAEIPERVPTMRPEGGPGDVAVPIGNVPQAGPRPNGPYSGPNTPTSMEPAQSGNLAKYGYIPESRTMVTEFNNGKVYQHTGVPKEIYDNFRNAESQGSYFAQNIKGRYTTRYRGSVSPTSSK